MTDLQKEIFEKIIKAAKDNHGEFHIYAPTQNEIPLKTQIDHAFFSQQCSLVIKDMLDRGYLKYRYPNSKFYAMLTDIGWKFTSFSELDKIEAEQESASKLELEKLQLEVNTLRNQFFDYPKVKNQAKWSVRWAAISGLTAIIAIVIALLKK